jgi:two-component system, chemotaxis family, protein-glutamate methylesterase/glutaminase
MAHHDVIVIGASSGGVEVLTKLLGRLPPDFPAAVFVVLHVRPDAPSYLPAILNRVGGLPVSHAVDREPIRRGRVYVAPPGFQTYVQRGHIGVVRGPRENLHRPAIDPLFRTAAHNYGERVIGIILSGSMDDGAAGLLAVKRAGGIAVVQDPSDAQFPDMPTNAMERADADYCVRVEDLAPLLTSLVKKDDGTPVLPAEVALETYQEAEQPIEAMTSEELGPPSAFTCPDCQGTLFEIEEGGVVRFRCRVGHAYSAEAMDKAQREAAERAMWSALRALEERSGLMRKLADHADRRGHTAVATMFLERATEVDRDVDAIRALITTGATLEPVGQEEG